MTELLITAAVVLDLAAVVYVGSVALDVSAALFAADERDQLNYRRAISLLKS